MEESNMVYESARPHLSKLAAIAQELNTASDAFTEELKAIERDLAELNVGIEVEVWLKDGATRVDAEEQRPYEARWLLGYKKLDGQWRIAVTEYDVYNPNGPANAIDPAARPEWRLVDEKPLLQASRELRIAAADKVEELLAAITKAAAERVASLRKIADAQPNAEVSRTIEVVVTPANESEPRTHEVVYEKPARQQRKGQMTSDGGRVARIAKNGLGDYASNLMKRPWRGSGRGKKSTK